MNLRRFVFAGGLGSETDWFPKGVVNVQLFAGGLPLRFVGP